MREAKRAIRVLSLTFFACYAAFVSLAQPIDIVPIHVDVVYTPMSVSAAGEHLLVYELHVTNAGNTGDVTLEMVEVWARTKLVELSGKELEDSIRRTGPEEGPPTLLKAGIRGIVNLFVLAEKHPDRVRHKMTVREAGSLKLFTVDCCEVAVARNSLRLAPPLHGSG